MSKPRRSKFASGLEQGFAKSLKKEVDASVKRRGLSLAGKTQQWLYKKDNK